MNGWELARRFAEARAGVPVLFVSGYPDDAFTQRGIVPDGVTLLEKPFTPKALAAKVEEMLGRAARP